MMISKVHCLYVFMLLYGGAIAAIFMRAFPRRRLLAEIERLRAGECTGEREGSLKRLLLAVPRQSRALKELGRSIGNSPAAVRRQYRVFQVLNLITISLIALLVVFSLIAHRVCGS